MSPSAIFAISALFPALIGPMPAENGVLVAQLCGGGTITIPLEKEGKDPSDCHPKACHAGNCRERNKRGI
jgi:hypothetical protein